MVLSHKIVCRKSPKLYDSYHCQALCRTCFNLTDKAVFNLLDNSQISRFPITSETSFQQTATIHRSTEVVYDNPKLLQVFRNLASYGNNLNQIAAYLNQGGKSEK